MLGGKERANTQNKNTRKKSLYAKTCDLHTCEFDQKKRFRLFTPLKARHHDMWAQNRHAQFRFYGSFHKRKKTIYLQVRKRAERGEGTLFKSNAIQVSIQIFASICCSKYLRQFVVYTWLHFVLQNILPQFQYLNPSKVDNCWICFLTLKSFLRNKLQEFLKTSIFWGYRKKMIKSEY